MSGTFPTTLKPISFKISSSYPSSISISNNLKVQSRSRGAQRFAITATYAAVHDWSAMAEIWGFIIDQQGRYDTFDYTLPDSVMPKNGEWQGTCTYLAEVTKYNHNATSTYTTSEPDFTKVGDLVKFGNHDKIYVIRQASGNTPVTGDFSCIIQPEMMETPTLGESIDVHQTGSPLTMKVQLASDYTEMSLDHCIKYGITVEMVERV